MVEELVRLLVVLIVIGALFWVISHAPIPAPYTPVAWVLYAIVVVIALVALLPFLGIHLTGLICL